MKTYTVGQRVRITVDLDPEKYPIGTETTVTGHCALSGFPCITLGGQTVTMIPGHLLPA
ncbi:hypothetical protein [Streptomyces mirabilis]|uniref:hypothetical protein n=1 Tax=Streptomyces mirabilis TaxID=68239 RepID=UPI00339DC74D